MNVKLMKKVRRLIAAEPKRLDMSVWGERYVRGFHDDYDRRRFPSCGTVACLAGWTVLASVPRKKWRSMFTSQGVFKGMHNIPGRAAKLLDVPYSEVVSIFYQEDGTQVKSSAEVLRWLDAHIAEGENGNKQRRA